MTATERECIKQSIGPQIIVEKRDSIAYEGITVTFPTEEVSSGELGENFVRRVLENLVENLVAHPRGRAEFFEKANTSNTEADLRKAGDLINDPYRPA